MQTTTTLTTNEAAAAGALMGGALGVTAVLAIALGVLLIVAMWKIFTKAGEKGWKSLIPIYDIYILFKISGYKSGFWALFVAYILAFVVTFIGVGTNAIVTDANGNITAITNPVFSVIPVIAAIVELVIGIVLCAKLSKAFKRGLGTTLGLIFLPNIFTLILGFGSAKYDKKVLSDK